MGRMQQISTGLVLPLRGASSAVAPRDAAISGDSPALLVTLIIVIKMAVSAESHALFLASRPWPHGSYRMEPGISASSQLQQSGATLRKAKSFAQVHTQPMVKSSSDRSIMPLLLTFLFFFFAPHFSTLRLLALSGN